MISFKTMEEVLEYFFYCELEGFDGLPPKPRWMEEPLKKDDK